MRGIGEGGSRSANKYSCSHGAQINFGDLTPYLTYGFFSRVSQAGILDAIFQSVFLFSLLLFWLCCLHGLRQTQRSASSKSSTGADAKYFLKHYILKSVTFWYEYGSGSSDPYLWIADPGGPKTYRSGSWSRRRVHLFIYFSYYFCVMMEGSGAGSVLVTNGSWCGSGCPKTYHGSGSGCGCFRAYFVFSDTAFLMHNLCSSAQGDITFSLATSLKKESRF